jgi:hypothetical protein
VEFLLYLVASVILSAVLAPKPPKPKAATLDDFDLPTAEEGRPIPVVFGTVRITGSNVLWYGDLRTKSIKKSGLTGSTTVGYEYYLGLHFGLCHGPVDAFTKLEAGDKVAWSGNVTTNSTVTVDAARLFGGRKKEGGLLGAIDVAMGGSAQTPNAYLSSKIGGPMPAFRGILSMTWRGTSTGGGYIGTNAYMKPWAFTVRRILQGWHGGTAWYSAKATIGTGMNPAHIIYEAITNPEWGMGLPTTVIDSTSFTAVADTLHAEGFGLSLLWNQEGSVEEFVQSVVDHIAAALAFNRTTGKYELVLLRGNYTPGSLPEYSPANVVQVTNYQRQAWGETVNELTLTYTDGTTFKTSAVTAHDLANIASQGARLTQTVNMPGITSPTIAQQVAVRELTARCTPLAKVTFVTDRSAWSAKQGDVVRFTWPQLGLSQVVLRVLAVRQGRLTDNAIEVEAIEDVFGLSLNVYTSQPAPGADPDPTTTEEPPDEPGASVISSTTTAPPPSPADGDRYLVPTGATGAWAGHAGEVAIWDAEESVWVFEVPASGTIVNVEDTGDLVQTVPGGTAKTFTGGGGYPAALGYAGI